MTTPLHAWRLALLLALCAWLLWRAWASVSHVVEDELDEDLEKSRSFLEDSVEERMVPFLKPFQEVWPALDREMPADGTLVIFYPLDAVESKRRFYSLRNLMSLIMPRKALIMRTLPKDAEPLSEEFVGRLLFMEVAPFRPLRLERSYELIAKGGPFRLWRLKEAMR